MRAAAAVIVGCVVACGHARQGSWIEEDAVGTSRAGGRGPDTDKGKDPETGPASGIVKAIVGGDRDAIDRASADELEAAFAALGGRAPAGAVAARRARIAHHEGDDELARAWIERARGAADAADVGTILDAIRAELGAPVDAKVIAVLLPERGAHAALGAELEAAIRLAPTGGAKLVFIDTEGDEAKAVAAVDRAASLGAIAILGPVGEREGRAAAARAAERGLPIALLAPGDGADPQAGVFRLTSSPADEARLAADAAAEEGFPSAGVFAPRDDVGDAMATAFVAEARARGLDVTADARYDPTASDLAPDVKALLGLDPATNPRLAAHLRKHGEKGWTTFVPDVPFSLLYVPDQYDRAALVAAFLPYYGVELRTVEIADVDALKRKYHGVVPQVVQLMGSSGWNHPALLTRGGDAVEHALIVDVFAGDRDGGAPGEFAQRFHDATGRDPTSAAAQAYDAARLVLAARATATTRADFVANLAHATLDDGACGAASIDAGGEIVRAPVLLQVDGGELELLSQ